MHNPGPNNSASRIYSKKISSNPSKDGYKSFTGMLFTTRKSTNIKSYIVINYMI